jgi:hypothetical protein
MIVDLARHLAAACSPEHRQRILGDAERDLARLHPPADFWPRLRAAYGEVPRKRGADARPDGAELHLGTLCSAGRESPK